MVTDPLEYERTLDLRSELIYLAENYLLDGDYKVISEHNSQIAEQVHKQEVARTWLQFYQLFTNNNDCLEEDQLNSTSPMTQSQQTIESEGT
jgi:hypothetical protein